jgi:branched-chain amino acid transport system ATP-binding protein
MNTPAVTPTTPAASAASATSTTAGEVLLRGHAITRRWGGLVALNQVNVELTRGSLHAVIGTNGAGKSTLINILSGEFPPSEGRVELLGQDVTQWQQPKRARAGLGRSYQRNTIYPSFSVFENCRLAAQATHQKPWQWWQSAARCEASCGIAESVVAKSGLGDLQNLSAGMLSHGQKRQLEIAMCLATRPQVLLLDEPLAGMGAEETDAGHARRVEVGPCDFAGRARYGRGVPHCRPRHRDGEWQRDCQRHTDRHTQQCAGANRLPGRTWMTASETILDARGIHAWYGSSHVLHGVDLSLRRGETMGLLGRNGMGKSTLIRTLLGHVAQRDGQISLFGQDVAKAKPYEVARLGVAYVPEGRGVFPNLSVRENLVMAARPGRDGRRDWSLERVLETFPRLAERLGNLGAQLSGGEQQMLSIGRALMTHPELIILDEATEGLAPLIVTEIWRVIGEIRKSGIATLIVDRDYRRVLAHADVALVLQKGQAVLGGRADTVAADPALAGFLGV